MTLNGAVSVAFRSLAAVTVSGVLLTLIVWQVDLEQISRGVSAINWVAILLAFVFISLNILIACFRYWNILRTFGQKVALPATIRANLFGLASGLLFFQIVGQTLSRWATLRNSGVSPAGVVVTSLYERVLALAVLMIAAAVAAWVLYDGLSIHIQRESLAIAKSLTLIAISALVVSIVVLRRYLSLLWRSVRRGTNWNAVAVGILLTLFVHGTMLAAYLSLIVTLAPDIPIADLAAASVIIMLAASLPISFAGWGIREFGAMFAFGYVGVNAGAALAVSIVVGVLSITSIAVLTGIVVLVSAPARRTTGSEQEVNSLLHIDLSRFLFLAIPIGVASLIMFQVFVPIGDGFVNINLADPLALIGVILFALNFKRIDFSGAVPHAALIVGTLSLLLVAGLIHGWWRFGYLDWAFVNRGVGWIFILGYIASGAALAIVSPVAGSHTIFRILICVAIVIVGADIGLWILLSFGFGDFRSITPWPQMFGESQNPNAFAFQLLLILAGAVTLGMHPNRRSTTRVVGTIVIGMLITAIYLTQSRTALVTFAFLIVGALAIDLRKFEVLAKGAAVAVFLVLVVPNVPLILITGASTLNAALEYMGLPLVFALDLPRPDLASMIQAYQIPLYRPASEGQRWESIFTAFTLFQANPIFGAGLGAGYQSGQYGTAPVVIHSTPLWVLAEFGLVGAAAVGVAFLSAAHSFWRRFVERRDAVYAFGLLALLTFVVFGLPHDIFYQRLFWFLLGLCLFKGGRLKIGRAPLSLREDRGLRADSDGTDDIPHSRHSEAPTPLASATFHRNEGGY